MSLSVLLTSAREDSEEIINWIKEHDVELMHLPLERYVEVESEDVFENIEEYETIIYGNKRNAIFFLKQAMQHNALLLIKERVNLTLHKNTAGYLEQAGIPAISTAGEPKPINMVEFMLRLRRTGPALYPCGLHTKEEIPGFLEELDIPVREAGLYDLKGPAPENLKSYRSAVAGQQPDIIIFHSRKAVNRIQAAFPDLDFTSSTIISADRGVTNKLKETGIAVTDEAGGNWRSVIKKLDKRI